MSGAKYAGRHAHCARLRLAGLLFSFLVVCASVGCSPHAKEERIDSIIRCNAREVQQIKLLQVPYQASLIDAPIVIDDRQAINSICDALNAARGFAPNHPAVKWSVKVELQTSEGTVSFVVCHTHQQNNGTFVSIMSNVTSGWNFGAFRSDELGPVLEELVKAKAETVDGS